jgi:hypothetical protein
MCNTFGSRIAISFTNDKLLKQCVNRGKTTAWPTRPPDFTTISFNLRGHVKSVMYAAAVGALVEEQQQKLK